MKLASIIIVNWNSVKFIGKCLNSVLSQDYKKLEILVIDNASSDGSLEFVETNFPSVKLIKNSKNIGFAKAVNQGVRLAEGAYIMPLNPDVVLSSDYVSEMVKVLEKEKKIGSAAAKLLRYDKTSGKSVIDSAGHAIFRNRLTRNVGNEEVDNGQYDKEKYVFGTCGAAPLYKREMLEDVKTEGEYYDEDFFAFWEDIDLDWRAQLRGWKCVYNPKAVAYHFRGGIRLPRPRIIEFSNYRNRYFTLIKNDYCWGLLKNSYQIIFTDMIKTGALLLRCPSALLAWIDIVKYFPKMLAKRRKIQERRLIQPRDVEKMWFKKFDYKGWFKRHLS